MGIIGIGITFLVGFYPLLGGSSHSAHQGDAPQINGYSHSPLISGMIMDDPPSSS